MRVIRRAAVLTVALLLFAPIAAGETAARAQEPNPADFSHVITHPLFPLSLTGPKLFEGEETDPDTDETVELRLESRLLAETKVVAGVTVAVLEERDFEDGELVEVALDYFAQHRDGTVYYFGEDVDNYEDGVVVNHDGSWLAGEDGAREGVIMPAQPVEGQTFQQERAPGVAEDQATVVSLDEAVTAPAGAYTGCMQTRDVNPLEPGVEEFKWYCPGVGLVREQGETSVNELVSVGPPPAPVQTASAPSPTAPSPTAPAGVVAPSTGSGGDGAAATWPFAGIAAVVALALLGGGLVVGKRRERSS